MMTPWSRVQDWVGGRHPQIAQVALNVAVPADETTYLLASVPVPSETWEARGGREWSRLYHGGRRLLRALSSLVAAGSESEDPEATEFVLYVFWPAILIYGHRPSRLLRLARKGDIEALDKLIRLDKRALSDERVGRWVSEIVSSEEREGRKKRLLAAIDGAPRRVKRSTVKAQLAAVATVLSQVPARLSGNKALALNASDLRDLFDAIAQDRTGAAQDPDLQDSPDAWKKAVERAMPLVEPVIADMIARTKVVHPMS